MVTIFGILGSIIAFFFLMVLAARFFFNRNSTDSIISKYQGQPEAKSIFVKKYPEADLERYQGTFNRVGMVVSLALVILAFSWTTYDRTASLSGDLLIPEDFEVEPPPTKREPPPPPPPPPPEIKVVEDEKIIEEEPEIEVEEIEEKTEIKPPVVVEEQIDENEVFMIVEDMPVFPGGEAGLLKYLSNIPYPPIAKENDIEGTVHIRFIVDKNGEVTNIEVLRGPDKILNDAAVNWIKKMPKWTPGKQRGKPVRVFYQVPIRFRLG
jgi:periplasmic protein TonB